MPGILGRPGSRIESGKASVGLEQSDGSNLNYLELLKGRKVNQDDGQFYSIGFELYRPDIVPVDENLPQCWSAPSFAGAAGEAPERH